MHYFQAYRKEEVMGEPSIIEIIARGVIIVDKRVLLCRVKGAEWHFLPGGHVERGEPVTHTLTRELREELGLEVRVDGFIGVVENMYVEDGKQHHELNLIFEAQMSVPYLPQSRESHIEFVLQDVQTLESVHLLPNALNAALRQWLTNRQPFFGGCDHEWGA